MVLDQPKMAPRILSGRAIPGYDDTALSDLRLFVGATTVADLDLRMAREVAAGVQRILELVDGCDAFDLVELLRLRELPVEPTLATHPDFDGNAAALELIVVVLLTRGGRTSPAGRRGEHASQQIEELHQIATRLIRLSTFRGLCAAHLSDCGSFVRLAAEYQSYFVGVRSHRYTSIEEMQDAALFDRPDMAELLSDQLGFTYGEFVAARDAVVDVYSTRLTEVRDQIGKLIMEAQTQDRELTSVEQTSFRDDIFDFIILPGVRASFTVPDVAARVALDERTIEAVLGCFSTGFDGSIDPASAAESFLRGRNPLFMANLVRDGAEYIMTSGPIGTDAFRIVAEEALKQSPSAWRRYDQKVRSLVSEHSAVEFIERLLSADTVAAPLEYVATKSDGLPTDVGAACSSPRSIGDLAEADALFVVGDVAICVEVKGRTIAAAARRGDLARLEREVSNVLGAGANQARRLEVLIRANAGVWRKDGTWLDLSDVREIHTVVVGLDTFGPLGVALGDLDAASLLGDGALPWIVSLHDLEVISMVLDRPAEFLLYLRRRTGPGIARDFRGVDELDVFMLFIEGGLYVEADPDRVREAYPRIPEPTDASRFRHGEDARPTLVGTHTDELDRWVYAQEAASAFEASKPVFAGHGTVLGLVDTLQEVRAPGWFRSGADLLAIAGDAQLELVEAVEAMVGRTREDAAYHTLMADFAGTWGHSMLVCASVPATMPIKTAAENLRIYAIAKKHQLGADRALGIVLTEEHAIVASLYLNDSPVDATVPETFGETTSPRPS